VTIPAPDRNSPAGAQGSAADGMPDVVPGTPELRRAMGPVTLTLVGVSNAIGAGIFVLTGVAAAQHAGPAIAISFGIAALVCLLTALCYAELSVLIPSAGGTYAYAAAAFGPFWAWIVGWCLILEYLVAGATVAVGWSSYAARGLADLGIMLPPFLTRSAFEVGTDQSLGWASGGINLPAIFIVLLCAIVLMRGIRGSVLFNSAMVAIKIAVILLVVGVGALYVEPANWHPFVPPNGGEFGKYGWSGIFTGGAVTFFAFTGFEAMSNSAREARRPERDLPIALLAALGICAVLYISMSLVLTGLTPYSRLDVASPVSAAIEGSGANLQWLETVVNVGTVLGLGSAVLISLYGQSRIFLAMAQDGLMPRAFGVVHPTTRTPAVGTLIIGLAAALIAGLFPISLLGELVSMGCLIAFASVCVAVVALRRRAPDAARTFRVPLYPWIPIMGALSCFGLMFSLPPITWRYISIWLAIGCLVFVAARIHLRLSRNPT